MCQTFCMTRCIITTEADGCQQLIVPSPNRMNSTTLLRIFQQVPPSFTTLRPLTVPQMQTEPYWTASAVCHSHLKRCPPKTRVFCCSCPAIRLVFRIIRIGSSQNSRWHWILCMSTTTSSIGLLTIRIVSQIVTISLSPIQTQRESLPFMTLCPPQS